MWYNEMQAIIDGSNIIFDFNVLNYIMEKVCGVYRIRNKINGKSYVGSSVAIESRFYGHRRLLRYGTHDNEHLQNAWSKYGEEAFVFETIEVCDKLVLRDREQFYINELNVLNRSFGYNIACNANLPPMTEETKRKIGIANKGKQSWIKGKKHSEETKRKLSEINKAKPTMKGRCGELSPRFNVEVSLEIRAKMRRAKLGKLNNHSSKPVVQMDGDHALATFPSAMEAQRQTGINAKNIAACLKRKRNKAGGYMWRYRDENLS